MPTALPAVRVEMQFTTGIWSEVASSDVNQSAGIAIHYGIDGNGPTDCVASTGTCTFVMRNDARNSGLVLGYYSPLHASKRTGWTFGIACQVVFSHPSDTATTVTITRSSQTATVAHTTHGKATGDYVTISGAVQPEYNGTWRITVTTANAYTFTVVGTPTTPATGTITSRKAYVKHRAKVHTIEPQANPKGERSVLVTSYDGMRDLVAADVRRVSLLINTNESTALTTLLDSLPTAAQPVLRSIDTGMETLPYVFDNIGDGVKAVSIMRDLALSSPYTLIYMKGDGTLTKESRQTRSTKTSQFTFSDSMQGVSIPTDLGNVYNHVRVTIHKRSVSSDYTEELYRLSEPIVVPPLETVEVWTNFTDPNDRSIGVGGIPDPIEAFGEYEASDNPLTGGVAVNESVVKTTFATTMKIDITSAEPTTTIYIIALTIVGKVLRDHGPQTYEAISVQSYGDRPINIDSPYLSNAQIAQEWATKLEDQYNDLDDQVNSITIVGNYSTNFMTQVLAREPGDVITITESLTGLSSVTALIHSVDLTVEDRGLLTCTWGLATVPPLTSGFVLDTDQLNVDALQF